MVVLIPCVFTYTLDQKQRFRKLLDRAEIYYSEYFTPLISAASIYVQLSVIFDEDDSFLTTEVFIQYFT